MGAVNEGLICTWSVYRFRNLGSIKADSKYSLTSHYRRLSGPHRITAYDKYVSTKTMLIDRYGQRAVVAVDSSLLSSLISISAIKCKGFRYDTYQ